MHVPTPDEVFSVDTVWKLTVAGAAVAGAFLVRNALEQGWKLATGRQPPDNPASPLTSWPEALIWSTSIGVGIGLGRLIAQRGAATGWKHATGHLPRSLLTGKDR
ncbi:MAG: DUF4235 domain-containing protein [Longimicrobiales bacterium]